MRQEDFVKKMVLLKRDKDMRKLIPLFGHFQNSIKKMQSQINDMNRPKKRGRPKKVDKNDS